ncbi:hypothetical protein OIO90_000180 [Microbotryomycetes sp. JL221]|nr:hypothetical protein OIO90_000180 [Microbotryomycetes sp. JL221]
MSSHHNPFSDPQGMDSNPFADPSVQSGLQSHSRVDQGSYVLDNDDDNDSFKPPTTTNNMNNNDSRDDMSVRLQDLARREQELAQRERQLADKAEHIRKHGRNNWPPGPFPLIYHDIGAQIPEKYQPTVLTLYRLWMFLVLTLAMNLVACVFLLISGASNGGADLGAGIMYLPVIGVLSFVLWYWPAYQGYRKEMALFYYIYFIFAGFHLAFSAYALIGIPSSGCAGIINTISRFADGSLVSAILCTIACVMWGMQGIASLWMYKQVFAHSKGEAGHSFASAKHELQMYGIKAFLFKSSTLPDNNQAAQQA